MYPPPDPNETIFEKLRKKPRLLIVWPTIILLCLAAGVFLTALNFSDNVDPRPIMAAAVVTAILCIGLLALVFILWPLLRWLVRKHLRATLIALAGLVALVVLFYAEENWRGRHDWETFKQRQEAKGEKLDVASFVPPAVPDDQNFAMTPIAASSYAYIIDKYGHKLKTPVTNHLNRLAMALWRYDNTTTPKNGDWASGTLTDLRLWQAYYRAPQTNMWRFGTNDFPTAANPGSPAEDVLFALSRRDSDIEELRSAAALPYSRFPLAYDQVDPMEVWLPHLSSLGEAVFTLQLRAIAELQLAQSDKAAADVSLILRLAEASHQEPFLVSALVRMRQINAARQPIYEGLAKHKWSEAQLAALDSQLAQLDFLADYQRIIRSQAAYASRMIEYFQRTRKPGAFLGEIHAANTNEQKIIDDACAIVPAGWFRENQLRFAQFYLEDCLPLVDMEKRKVNPASVDAVEAKLQEALDHPDAYNVLERLIMGPVARMTANKYVVTENFVYAQECVDLTRVAIALERYRLVHGQYPDSLASLAPQFLAKVPHDIIGGGNLIYRNTSQNFVLYSIGWDGIDDGGVRDTLKEFQLGNTPGDWVWQYP